MVTLNRRSMFALAGGVALAPLAARAQLRSVVDTLAADLRFNRFLELIGRAGLTETLRGVGPFTLFAPTDAGFNAAPSGLIEDIASQGTGGGAGGGTLSGESPDRLRLQAFLQYHIITGQAWSLAQLTGEDRRLKTENGALLLVSAKPGEVVTLSNPAPGRQSGTFGAGGLSIMPPTNLVQADIPASNGVVHAINGVLFP